MYFTRQEDPGLETSVLRSLRRSLNTPVVVLEDLPTGPASAAIAALRDPAGSRVVIAIRSERSGQAVFFGAEEDRRDWRGPEVAVEAALSFAESMGFLFEDDRLAPGSAEAARLWEELLDACAGSRRVLPRPPQIGPRPVAVEPPEAAGPDREGGRSARASAPGPALEGSLSLTKFRRAPGSAPRRPAERLGAPATAHPPGRFRVGGMRRGG